MFASPSDIGYNGDEYILPDLKIVEHKIKTDKVDNGLLFNEIAISATNYNSELKRTTQQRMQKAAEIANSTNQQVIVWIKQNDEGKVLRDLIPDAVEVKGSDSSEIKESRLLGFAKNDFRVLITKSKIAQFGLNYQNCHIQVFASLDFSFESLYQSERRSHRFGQKEDVKIHIIITDTMNNVAETIKEKTNKFEELKKEMNKSMSYNGTYKKLEKREPLINEKYTLYNGDCVQEIKKISDNSIGFSVFSPPFADLYTYSDHIEDMGNSTNYNEFIQHFKYLAHELFRVVKEGRNIAIHCMDLPIQKGKEGFIGLRDFSGMILDIFREVGFIYHSRVTIWKNPVTEMQRTKALGLLHKQIKKDSTMNRVGIPDYVLVFRKDGERNDPVMNTELSVDLWQQYASPVWMDINYGKTLNNYRLGRHDNDEKHICPLQLETIERLVHLYTNPGDTVFSPFLGIGSEGYQSVAMKRKFIGIELKESYFDIAYKNLEQAIKENGQMTLEDLCI